MDYADLLKKVQQRLLRPVTFLLAIAFSLYPLVPNPAYKLVVLFLLLMSILRVLFDIEKSITDRLARIESYMVPNPPSWPNFNDAQHKIFAKISAAFNEDKRLHLEVIGCSARFSWRMIEDLLPAIIRNNPERMVQIDIALTTEHTMRVWRLDRWVGDLNRTLTGMENFSSELDEEIGSGRLVLNRIDYDIIPQWHGVLVNRRILFMGQTDWIFKPSIDPELRIGQCKYRLFEIGDQHEGADRIEMFSAWMERFRIRDREIHGTREIPYSPSHVRPPRIGRDDRNEEPPNDSREGIR